MSTKNTLVFNMPHLPLGSPVPKESRDQAVLGFRLYEECLEDDGSVYLELTGTEFTATHQEVTVKIPAAVWNRIIRVGVRNARSEK